MPVVDLYLPDDLPIAADADLGRTLAAVVDAATADAAAPCAVFVHRLPVYAVVSADAEGVRTVRVQVSCDAGPWLDLAPGLDDVVRTYLRSLKADVPTRITVSVQAVTETNAVTWPHPVPSLAV
ncbi:hypothetical protein [Nocardioides marmorisolisilvae]|uniref:Uncharacterized protein n=1 Tax=Nocardioides marmorisolisilvae TaxID=1542737 RepID=A0A3N0DS30_9ACTN|nr:hypothetical protein [Nocardioides marmorisolisilvae]RNL78437.1 hypothetical protein EFL95_04885 [Nocardioides marmorisolisilvae]